MRATSTMPLPKRMPNPVARQRWVRFRRNRRGFISLILLITLYLFSLGAELICNDRPLVVKHEGSWYFPVLFFYPEDAFTGNGVMTRANYKRLAASSVFAPDSGNWMVFPPVPYGPNEIINPDSLRGEERVTLSLRNQPRVGTVQLDAAGGVVRSQAAELFLADRGEGLVADAWNFPPALRGGIGGRFANQAQPALRSLVTNQQGRVAEVSLTAFTPRSQPPRDVRITFREQRDRQELNRTLVFAPDRTLVAGTGKGHWWDGLSGDEQERLAGLAGQGFDGSLVSRNEELAGIAFSIDVRRNDVQWPFRPNPRHWLGLDNAGRDVFARILYGLRTSMTFGLLLVIFSMAFGTLMGALQGYFGGRVDLVAQRLIEVWSTIPFLYVMIWLGSLYGRSFSLLLFCYGIFNWIGISSYVRAEFLRLRRMPFVDAARCLGLSNGAIMFRHILPNALTPIITFFPFSLVGAIGSLAMLDYLGFGLPPPTPSWGELLQQAQSFRWAWWLILYPSLALFAVILMGVFIGEAVRDAYDPKPVMKMA
jgi:microcin C transport system permease protein